jgi:hypothetical protein
VGARKPTKWSAGSSGCISNRWGNISIASRITKEEWAKSLVTVEAVTWDINENKHQPLQYGQQQQQYHQLGYDSNFGPTRLFVDDDEEIVNRPTMTLDLIMVLVYNELMAKMSTPFMTN